MIEIALRVRDATLFVGSLPEEGLIAYQGTGSYFICNPPVTDTDKDVLLLVKDSEDYKHSLLEDCWTGCTGYEDKEPHFFAARKGEINLIVTDELQWYLRFAAATELAKKLNLLKKEERISLFEQVLGKET